MQGYCTTYYISIICTEAHVTLARKVEPSETSDQPDQDSIAEFAKVVERLPFGPVFETDGESERLPLRSLIKHIL